jgi:hypothetical protein
MKRRTRGLGPGYRNGGGNDLNNPISLKPNMAALCFIQSFCQGQVANLVPSIPVLMVFWVNVTAFIQVG